MPELPEVETARRQVAAATYGRKILRARCAKDEIVVRGTTPTRIARALKGRTVADTGRRGKHFWIIPDRGPCLALHLGMTGRLSFTKDPLDRPRFWKLSLELDDGGSVHFADPRRLGRIRLLDDPEKEAPIAKLGPDPLIDMPGRAAFAAELARRKRTLKGLLLDQGFLAGVGNWIADEVLYQCRLDPRREGASLDRAEADRLHRTLLRIVKKAVDVSADADRFPKTWLFHRRWGKKAGQTSADGHPIEYLEVAGRTTAWVPAVQG